MSQVPILEGREFRELWEEHLTPQARREVRRAVRRGQSLDDPGLASVAVSLARQCERISVLEIAGYAVHFLAWLSIFVWLLTIPNFGMVAYWRLLAGASLLAVPAKLIYWYRFERPHYRRSEALNLRALKDV